VGTRLGMLYDCDMHLAQYFHQGEPYNKPFRYANPLPEDTLLHGLVEVYGKSVEVRLVHGTQLEWTTETHREFPEDFRQIVKTLLLCHRCQATEGNLVAMLPKFLLLEFFVILGELYHAARIPTIRP
jgi:hypothetical protein